MLDWLESNLKSAANTSRKFIISDHVYDGTRYNENQMWHEEFQARYYQTLLDHSSQIIMEVVGHDHIADLRYHSSQKIPGVTDAKTKYDLHNVFVAPGITPNKKNNPGVAHFEISDAGVEPDYTMEEELFCQQVVKKADKKEEKKKEPKEVSIG